MTHQMPVLGGIAAGIRWVEELVSVRVKDILSTALLEN